MKERYWMVRKSSLEVLRPMDESALLKKIEAGEITPSDEMCPSEGYWFTLQDVVEVKKHFGDEVKLGKWMKSEPTEDTNGTDTQLLTKDMASLPLARGTSVFSTSNQKPKAPAREPGPTRSEIRRNLAVVSCLFFVFILFLIWVWSGSY